MTIPTDPSDQIFSSQPIKGSAASPAAGAEFQKLPATTQGPGKPFTSAQGPAGAQGVQPPFIAPGAAGPSFDTLISQVGMSQDSLATIRNQLNTKNLQFKRSQQHLIRNKLSDASTHLRAANSRLGVETPPMPSQAGARPIERFLNYVSDGENQLASAQQQILSMQNSGDQLRASDFLLIQVKFGQAQQEIEYASMLLGKVVDSIKSLMNTAL